MKPQIRPTVRLGQCLLHTVQFSWYLLGCAKRATVGGDEKEIIQRSRVSVDDPVYLLIMSVVAVV